MTFFLLAIFFCLVHVTRVPGDILRPHSLILPGPGYRGPRWIQSHFVAFFALALYSSLVHVMGVPGDYRAILWHSSPSLSTPLWSPLQGSQVSTEPSCDILCPRSLILPGPCYGGPRWIHSHLVPFFFLALYSSCLVHFTGVPGEYRAILCHSLSQLYNPPWTMLRGFQVITEPSCDVLCPRSFSSLVHVTVVPGEYRVVTWHYLA